MGTKKIHTIETSPANFQEFPEEHVTEETQDGNENVVVSETNELLVHEEPIEDIAKTVSQKLSERLKAYGASSWMCKRVTLGNVTLVPGVGGVAVIPELDLSVRQRNRLRAAKRSFGSPVTSLTRMEKKEMSTNKDFSPKDSQISQGTNLEQNDASNHVEENATSKLIAQLESQSFESSDEDDYASEENDNKELLIEDRIQGFDDTTLSSPSFAHLEPHSMEASAPWYSKHRRSKKVRDEVQRDIARMLEKDGIWQNKSQPTRNTISREKLVELSRPRGHENQESTQKQLIVHGTADKLCHSRRKEQKMRTPTFQLIKRPEKIEVVQWRQEKKKMEQERVERAHQIQEQNSKRGKMLHNYLSKNASQSLSSYIESRKKQLEKAKEKREKSDGTFNTLKGGGSCWDLKTLRQQGIRVIR